MKKVQTILILGSLFLGLMLCAPAFAQIEIKSIEIEAETIGPNPTTGEGEVIISPQPGTVIMPPMEEAPAPPAPARPVPVMKKMRELDVLLKEARKAEETGDEQEIEVLKRRIDMAVPVAEEFIPLYPEGVTGIPTEGIPAEKSIEARTGHDISNYFKVQVGELMREKMDVDQRITMLKELRGGIDTLIEELIQGKEEITSDEMSELVEEIKVKPREIQADNIRVQTTAKKIMFRLQGKPMEVRPTEEKVIIKDEDIEVEVEELTIKSDGAIMVGKSEVKVTPSQIMAKIKTEAKEIRLAEEENQAVYKVKTQVRRKLFGFIPIGMTKRITASAVDVDAEIIKEKLPWWSFLTSK